VFPTGNCHPAEVIRPEGGVSLFELPNLPETYHLDEIAERIKWRLERFVWRVRSWAACASHRAPPAPQGGMSAPAIVGLANKKGAPAGPPFSFFCFATWIGY
jgi:hypothetical protein